MKLTILGCGTSTGVPVPACNCAVCRSNDPKNERLRTSALIEDSSGFAVLIDTSPDLRIQTLRRNIQRIDAVLFTHAHADHIMGLDDLRGFNFVKGAAIDCYADGKTLAALRRCFKYVFEPDPDYEGGLLPQILLHEIAAGTKLTLGTIEVQAFSLKHGREEILGYRFGEIGYATDCNFIPTETIAMLRGVRYLILDGLRFEPHRTHFTIAQAIELAAEIGAEHTYLTHMTHSIDYRTVSAKLPAHVALAYDGLTISV